MNDKQQLAAMGEHMREMEECKSEFKVPDGWRLVPISPTSKMLAAIGAASPRYKAMLAAAPEYKP
ncbi:MAG: hypothetical protein ACRCXB_07260 [Aeromonadaceae bacterium]